MSKQEAYFVSHCDNENCSLGSFEFDCPVCDKHNRNFNLWWKDSEIYNGEKQTCKCEYCKVELQVNYDEEQYAVYVSKV